MANKTRTVTTETQVDEVTCDICDATINSGAYRKCLICGRDLCHTHRKWIELQGEDELICEACKITGAPHIKAMEEAEEEAAHVIEAELDHWKAIRREALSE